MANPRYTGDVWSGTVSLRIQDPAIPAKQDPYVIPDTGSAYVEMRFPGDPDSIVIDSLTSGEITITDAANGDFSWTVPSAKSADVSVSSPTNRAILVDIVVYDASGDQQQTFQESLFPVAARANP